MPTQKIQDFILKKPYLTWYIKDPHKLSPASILEHLLNYGNWSDIQQFIQLYGLNSTASLFDQITQKKRNNLFPEIKHYFQLYFQHHAS